LSIDDVVAGGTMIPGHLDQARTGIDHGDPRGERTRPPGVPPIGIAHPRELAREIAGVQPELEAQARGTARWDPDRLPWDELDHAVATGAAGAILRELGGPARIARITDDIRRLDEHVAIVEQQQGPAGQIGPPGPAGPEGPQGPPGERGAPGRD